jgi:uroporphyrinogen-III synthase
MTSEPIEGSSPRLWVTRARPGADATAARLTAMGFTPVVAPVLEIRAKRGAAIDLKGVDALAFTSAAGVSAFASLREVRALAVFAVGDATAEAARAAGFTDVRSAGGDALALVETIAAADPLPKRVLNPTAAEPAADLTARLLERGVSARSVAVYESWEADAAPPPPDLHGLLIHSAKAGQAVARRLSGRDVSAMDVYAISLAAAAPLAGLGFRRIGVAAAPNEAALLDLLER